MNPELLQTLLAHGATLTPTVGELLARESVNVRTPMTEKEFQRQVIDLAKAGSWRIYHTHDSRKSAAGFPDLTLVRKAHLIFVELKTDSGRPTADQLNWLDDLRDVRTVAAELWRPADLSQICEVLR